MKLFRQLFKEHGMGDLREAIRGAEPLPLGQCPIVMECSRGAAVAGALHCRREKGHEGPHEHDEGDGDVTTWDIASAGRQMYARNPPAPHPPPGPFTFVNPLTEKP